MQLCQDISMRRFFLLLICFAALLAGPYIWMRDVHRQVPQGCRPPTAIWAGAAGAMSCDGGGGTADRSQLDREMELRDVQRPPHGCRLPAAFRDGDGGAAVPDCRSLNVGTAWMRAGVFLLSLVAAGGLLVFFRRRGGWLSAQRRTGQLAVVDTLRLGTHHHLAVVEWDGQRLLIGITQHQIALIVRKGEGRTAAERQSGSNNSWISGS